MLDAVIGPPSAWSPLDVTAAKPNTAKQAAPTLGTSRSKLDGTAKGFEIVLKKEATSCSGHSTSGGDRVEACAGTGGARAAALTTGVAAGLAADLTTGLTAVVAVGLAATAAKIFVNVGASFTFGVAGFARPATNPAVAAPALSRTPLRRLPRLRRPAPAGADCAALSASSCWRSRSIFVLTA